MQKVIRKLTDEEIEGNQINAEKYVELMKQQTAK